MPPTKPSAFIPMEIIGIGLVMDCVDLVLERHGDVFSNNENEK